MSGSGSSAGAGRGRMGGRGLGPSEEWLEQVSYQWQVMQCSLAKVAVIGTLVGLPLITPA